MIIRRTLSLMNSFCTNSLKIPELIQGDQLSSEGRYSLAVDCYSRVVQIMNSARMNQAMGSDYLEAVSKLAATEYLLKKYNSTQKLIESLKFQKLNDGYNKYFLLLYWSSHDLAHSQSKFLTTNNKNRKVEQQISLIVQKLTNVQAKINQHDDHSLPILWKISENINNATDYRKLLTSLIERSPKAQKTEKPKEQYLQMIKKNINSELYLLYFMSLILQNKSISSSDKQLINKKVNEILKDYEKNRQKQVYKPLTNIIVSLIGQKQYMSAEGMIGHIKTSEMTLINSYQSQDKNLINNIYRMLVTRAHNEPIELGWSKQVPISFGNLVIQRIIKAPLQGHSIDNLIC